MYPSGVSFVVCCHNSEKRISKTLEHLIAQNETDSIPWEIILVNNASTDSTGQVVKKIFSSLKGNLNFKIIDEPKLGLVYAKVRGINESKYDFISFIDDDNRIANDWVKRIFDIMSSNNNIGACGSLNKPVSDIELPYWFKTYERSYAVGEQGECSGDVTWEKGVLFGAGLTVRKTAWKKLIDEGFNHVLSGRKGKALTCGEDYELCLALRLNGWLLWYAPELELFHYLPKQRLNWGYLRKMLSVVGRSSVSLEPYFKIFNKKQNRGSLLTIIYKNNEWLSEIVQQSKVLRKKKCKTILSRIRLMEGDPDVLEIDKAIGKIISLIKCNKQYDESLKYIHNAKWNHQTNINTTEL